MIRRVLVALDDSPRAPGVFARASELAYGLDAELILFRAVSVPQEFPASGAGSHPDALRAELSRAAHEELMTYVRKEPELSIRVVVKVELSPDHAIVDAAEELNVDLIIIGNHGYHGVDRILGTTAGRVIHRAKRDVMVVYRGPVEQT